MSKKTKKVVLFLVEGVSEETALGLPMKNYFETNEVRFEVVHGDITTILAPGVLVIFRSFGRMWKKLPRFCIGVAERDLSDMCRDDWKWQGKRPNGYER